MRPPLIPCQLIHIPCREPRAPASHHKSTWVGTAVYMVTVPPTPINSLINPSNYSPNLPANGSLVDIWPCTHVPTIIIHSSIDWMPHQVSTRRWTTNPSSSREAVITYEVVSRGSPWPTTIFEITSSHDHHHHRQQIENLIPRIWNFPCTQS